MLPAHLMPTDAKLKKLFPNHPSLRFRYQHVYGRTSALMEFVTSFDVTTVRACIVKDSLMNLRNIIDAMIDGIPEDKDVSNVDKDDRSGAGWNDTVPLMDDH